MDAWQWVVWGGCFELAAVEASLKCVPQWAVSPNSTANKQNPKQQEQAIMVLYVTLYYSQGIGYEFHELQMSFQLDFILF